MSALCARALVAAGARRACTQKPCISASLTLSYNWLRVLRSGGTSCNVRRRCWLRRLVYLWGARAQHVVLMRLASHWLPQRATYFADGPIRHHRSWPPPRPRRAVLAILKTRNQLYDKLRCGKVDRGILWCLSTRWHRNHAILGAQGGAPWRASRYGHAMERRCVRPSS